MLPPIENFIYNRVFQLSSPQVQISWDQRPNLRTSIDRSFIRKTPMKKWLPEVAGTRTGWKRGFDFGSLGTRIICLKYEKQELPLPIIVVIYDYIFSVSQSTVSYNNDSFIYSVAMSDVFCKC